MKTKKKLSNKLWGLCAPKLINPLFWLLGLAMIISGIAVGPVNLAKEWWNLYKSRNDKFYLIISGTYGIVVKSPMSYGHFGIILKNKGVIRNFDQLVLLNPKGFISRKQLLHLIKNVSATIS